MFALRWAEVHRPFVYDFHTRTLVSPRGALPKAIGCFSQILSRSNPRDREEMGQCFFLNRPTGNCSTDFFKAAVCHCGLQLSSGAVRLGPEGADVLLPRPTGGSSVASPEAKPLDRAVDKSRWLFWGPKRPLRCIIVQGALRGTWQCVMGRTHWVVDVGRGDWVGLAPILPAPQASPTPSDATCDSARVSLYQSSIARAQSKCPPQSALRTWRSLPTFCMMTSHTLHTTHCV